MNCVPMRFIPVYFFSFHTHTHIIHLFERTRNTNSQNNNIDGKKRNLFVRYDSRNLCSVCVIKSRSLTSAHILVKENQSRGTIKYLVICDC